MNIPGTTGGDRRRLRRSLRTDRRHISPATRASAEQAVHRHVASSHYFAASRNVALYDAFDGELDVWPLAGIALCAGKTVCLPVIGPGRRLEFARLDHNTALAPNDFGILEPDDDDRQIIPIRRIDLVITPLVGFDAACNRLGMGAGYYDITFSFLNHRRSWQHPKLVGVAFDQQKVRQLERANWDVPLWRVVTPNAIYGPNGPLTGDPRG